MSAVTTVAPPMRPTAPDRVTDRAMHRAVTGLAVRQIRQGAFVVAGLAGGLSAFVVATYRATVENTVDAASLAALAGNPAIRTLFGTPAALDDPGGFAVWRTGTPLAVLVAAWAMLAAVRITRGEEDAGRWNLLLGGGLPITTVVRRHVTVITVACATTGAAVTVGLAAAGTTAGGAVVYGTGIALVAVFFAGCGLLCAQVFGSRSRATGAVTGLLGVGLLVRMLGDGVGALGGVRWASPFGLLALSRPFDGDRIGPLLALAAGAAAVIAAGVLLSGRRDLGAGLLAGPATRRTRPWLLGSVGAFAVRTALRPTLAWSIGIGTYFFVVGTLAVSMTGFLTDNSRFADLAAEVGFAGLGTVDGYVAALFALLAVPTGLFAMVRTAQFAADEAAGRLTLVLANPVTRLRQLTAHSGATLAATVVLLGVAGVAAWAGAAVAGANLALGAALAGAWNVLPIVLLSLGAAVLGLGLAPRAVAVIGAVPTVGGFLIHVFALSYDWPAWIGDLSPFAHLAAVPTTTPNWLATTAMTGVAAVLAGAGAVAFHRRDLRG